LITTWDTGNLALDAGVLAEHQRRRLPVGTAYIAPQTSPSTRRPPVNVTSPDQRGAGTDQAVDAPLGLAGFALPKHV
jgi:hypothetical protein